MTHGNASTIKEALGSFLDARTEVYVSLIVPVNKQDRLYGTVDYVGDDYVRMTVSTMKTLIPLSAIVAIVPKP